jgi:hypothetical protein
MQKQYFMVQEQYSTAQYGSPPGTDRVKEMPENKTA